MNIKELHASLLKMVGGDSVWVDNSVQISLGNGTEICLEYLTECDELYMYGTVASISEELFGKYALSLLKANLFCKDTGGLAVLAYDAEEGRVVLWDKLILAHINRSQFQERFSYMYLSILHWSDKIRKELLGGDIMGLSLSNITG